MEEFGVPRYHVQVVRESESIYLGRGAVSKATEVAKTFRDMLGDLPHEEFWVLYLDTKNVPIGSAMIGRGTINQTLVRAVEVFRYGILLNALAVVLIHNHPSGNLEPSKGDRAVTKQLAKAGQILGIKVLDHIIVSSEGIYSFGENYDPSLNGAD